jgi:hypothetical protein
MGVSGLLLWVTRVNPGDMTRQVLWTSLAGMVVWLHLVVTYGLLKHELQYEIRTDRDAAVAGGSNAGIYLIFRILNPSAQHRNWA